MTNVKQIRGTEGYIDLADRRGMCQNIADFQDCLMEDYMERGLEACKCIPLYLRKFKNVRLMNSEFCFAIY